MLLLAALFIGTIASIHAAGSLPFAKNFTVINIATGIIRTNLAMRCNPPPVAVDRKAVGRTKA
jgi:hypothetical protein